MKLFVVGMVLKVMDTDTVKPRRTRPYRHAVTLPKIVVTTISVTTCTDTLQLFLDEKWIQICADINLKGLRQRFV